MQPVTMSSGNLLGTTNVTKLNQSQFYFATNTNNESKSSSSSSSSSSSKNLATSSSTNDEDKKEEATDSDENNDSSSNNNSPQHINNDDLDLDLIQNELKNSESFINEYRIGANNGHPSFSAMSCAPPNGANKFLDSFSNRTFLNAHEETESVHSGGTGSSSCRNEKIYQIYEDDLVDGRDKLVGIFKNEFFVANSCFCDAKQNLFVYGGSKPNACKFSKSLQRKLVSLYETLLASNNVSLEIASELLYQKGKLSSKLN